MGPNSVLVFHVPNQHSCWGNLFGKSRYQKGVSCLQALDRYLTFMMHLVPHNRIVMMVASIVVQRVGDNSLPWGISFCNSHMLKWKAEIDRVLARIAPDVLVLDIAHPTRNWIDLDGNNDLFRRHCPLQDRHLTCLTQDAHSPPESMGFAAAFTDSRYISPPARVANQALMETLS